jgi:prepilin-type N-terminal cleavage/methylation domain-containing protein/prepilin-type processing-associated H-X9-DG protein
MGSAFCQQSLQEGEAAMLARRKGFTLIELLVVIAIIAILAAMLFPVFARARESARRIQCLSNVKNIATAVQMYLTDYDRFPPGEHDAAAKAYFDAGPGYQGGPGEDCAHLTDANPYLRWALVFDEYVRDREVWHCASAKLVKGVTVVIGAVPNHLRYWQDHENLWTGGDCKGGGPCGVAWPPGWGGSISDSLVQGHCATAETGAFQQAIGTAADLKDMKTSQLDDPSWTVVCGDAGGRVEISSPALLAFPEVCALNGCGTCCYSQQPEIECCAADWTNCPLTPEQSCLDYRLKLTFWTDASLRKRFSRHLGGSNMGFADGHATWMASDAIIANAPNSNDPNNGRIRGIGCSCLPPPPGELGPNQ